MLLRDVETAAPSAAPTAAPVAPELEAERTLTARAQKRFGSIPAAAIVKLVLRAAQGADYPVAAAALEALIRRRSFAERDQLRVVARPAAAETYYVVGTRGRKKRRSYEVWLRSMDPIDVSCSCADYARSSLGLCKHALVVLEAAHAKKGRHTRPAPRGAMLSWDPLHPAGTPSSGGVSPSPRVFDRAARLRIAGSSVPRLAGIVRDRPSAEALASPDARWALLRAMSRAIESGALFADPAARTIVREELARAERARVARRALARARKALGTLERRLYPYQREGVLRFLESGRLLLADDMGLGKTTQAVACCHALLEAKAVRRALLVVPAALKPQWVREWSSISRVPITDVSGSPAERAQLYRSTRGGALLIGYEQLLRDLPLVSEWVPELVVLDEAQRIKNWSTKSAAAVKSLSAAYRLVLTGTPMENRLAELASIVDFVDDVALEPKWRLAPLHSIADGDGGSGSAGARHLGVLRARLAPILLRRVRQEVIAQLPARTDTRVPVEMTDYQREEHAGLAVPIAAILSRSKHRPLTQAEFLRLMQLLTQQRIICNGVAQLRFREVWEGLEARKPTEAVLASLFTPKLAAFRALTDDLCLTQRRKIVVFSQWRSMLRLAGWSVRDLLAGAGMRALFFTGAESAVLRERAIVDFHDDPAAAVLFLTDAGGVGLNLQRAASACVQLELPWNPAVMEQRIGRIHRLGQTSPIDVFHLSSEEGIEARIAGLLGSKRALFDSVFDGTTDTVHFDRGASFLSTVRELFGQELRESGPGHGEPEEEETIDDLSDAEPEALADAEPALPAPEPVAAPAPASAAPPSSAAEPFRVVRRADGGLSIDVPPAMAEPLAGLLASLAQALRAGAPPN